MGMTFWIQHQSFSDIATELREVQSKIEYEFEHHLAELEKIKKEVAIQETENKNLKTEKRELLSQLKQKEQEVADLSFSDIDLSTGISTQNQLQSNETPQQQENTEVLHDPTNNDDA